MQRLATQLLPSSSTVLRREVTLYGSGGIGKTRLAVEFIKGHAEAFSSIFCPLATGAALLTLLLALLPFRTLTFLALGSAFLAFGAALIATIVSLIAFGVAQGRLGLLFSVPVDAKYDRCQWMVLSAFVLLGGTFIFLLAAIPPKTERPSRVGEVLKSA